MSASNAPVKHMPENAKDENYSIASVIVKSVKTKGTYKKIKKAFGNKSREVDEYHIKADMILCCHWHDPNSGQWKTSEINYSKTFNHSIGERVPEANNPVVFNRVPDGGFTL